MAVDVVTVEQTILVVEDPRTTYLSTIPAATVGGSRAAYGTNSTSTSSGVKRTTSTRIISSPFPTAPVVPTRDGTRKPPLGHALTTKMNDTNFTGQVNSVLDSLSSVEMTLASQFSRSLTTTSSIGQASGFPSADRAGYAGLALGIGIGMFAVF